MAFTEGSKRIEVDKTEKDYLKIEYAGGGNLYILATQLELIQKYAGADAKKPKLNKLGGQEWNKTKSRVRGAVKEIAEDLVKLYAARQSESGFAYGPDTVWQREFEEMFPFEETEDQDLAIAATKADMESTKIDGSSDLRGRRLRQDGRWRSARLSRRCRTASRWHFLCRQRFWRSSIIITLQAG